MVRDTEEAFEIIKFIVLGCIALWVGPWVTTLSEWREESGLVKLRRKMSSRTVPPVAWFHALNVFFAILHGLAMWFSWDKGQLDSNIVPFVFYGIVIVLQFIWVWLQFYSAYRPMLIGAFAFVLIWDIAVLSNGFIILIQSGVSEVAGWLLVAYAIINIYTIYVSYKFMSASNKTYEKLPGGRRYSKRIAGKKASSKLLRERSNARAPSKNVAHGAVPASSLFN